MHLVTGAAGFIGFHTSLFLLKQGKRVLGIDNMNAYYDPALKQARLDILMEKDGFSFIKADIADADTMFCLPEIETVTHIIHLAAQAGVRYSLQNPFSYAHANLNGHMVMLELARKLNETGTLVHFVYASSSSVYGGNEKIPFSEDDAVNAPVSLYAATKRADELLTQSYASLYHIPSTGLRFFTVYGPYGRPDMAYFSFTQKILSGETIDVFNHGNMRRDFTYIDDIVAGVISASQKPPLCGDQYTISGTPHRIFNLGNNTPEALGDFIACIEQALGKTAQKNMRKMAKGDVVQTYADISRAQEILGFAPKTSLKEGIPKFVDWFQNFYSEGLA